MTGDLYVNEQISPREKAIRSREAFGKLLPLLKPHRRRLMVCFFLLAGATLLSLCWPILLKRALDVNIENHNYRGLVITALGIGLIQATALALQYIQRIKLETIGQDIMVALKCKLFDHILSLDISFFDRNPVGRLMARIESDTEALRMLFTNTVVLLVGDALLLVGIFAVMLYYSWRLSLVLLTVAPLIGVIIYVFWRRTTPHFLEVRKRMAEITAQLTEFLHGVSIIQIFHRGAYAQARLNSVNRSKFLEDRYTHIAVVLFFNTIFFLEPVMIALVLFFGMLWAKTGMITIGTIGLFIVLIWRLYEPLWRVSDQLATIQKAIAGAKRIFALLSEKQKLPDPLRPVRWSRLEKGIRFEHVWFSYTDDDNHALKDITFEVPIGRRVALAGVTGGGKTTVISLLLRFYDPQRGRIMVDGIDVRDIRQDELRQRFALVLQDIVLFPGNVHSNLGLETEEIPPEKIITAARTVEADRFIRRLADGYRTEVSEKGANFSRGERQLLSFARALVVDPDVMILDEATSSVDPQTERTIQTSLKKLMAGRTSLIIAHRLSTILDVDQIHVLRHGEIVERGTHTELIRREGYYAKLFQLQFKTQTGVAAHA
jgi:ATP-binding cassette subfamily B multidrug efflux pump